MGYMNELMSDKVKSALDTNTEESAKESHPTEEPSEADTKPEI